MKPSEWINHPVFFRELIKRLSGGTDPDHDAILSLSKVTGLPWRDIISKLKAAGYGAGHPSLN